MAWRIGEVTVIGEVEELGAPPAYGASKVTLVCNGAKACSKGSATCADAPIGTAGGTWGTIVAAVMAALMCRGRTAPRTAPRTARHRRSTFGRCPLILSIPPFA